MLVKSLHFSLVPILLYKFSAQSWFSNVVVERLGQCGFRCGPPRQDVPSLDPEVGTARQYPPVNLPVHHLPGDSRSWESPKEADIVQKLFI